MKSHPTKLAQILKRFVRPICFKRRTRTQLNLERLDQRVVPATFTADSALADGALGTATVAGGTASLRRAISLANANGAASNTINLSGTYLLTLAQGAQENANASGDLDIRNTGIPSTPKTYRFVGDGTAVIQQTQLDRVFQILGKNVVVQFENVTITGGHAVDDGTAGATPGSTNAKGGGILNFDGANISFVDTILTGNEAGNGAVDKTTVMNGANGAKGTPAAYAGKAGGAGKSAFGGALYSKAGLITISGSSAFTGNRVAAGDGGDGGAGLASVVATKASGNGGIGGKGGTAQGGGICAEGGSITISDSAVIASNDVHTGTGGRGGDGGLAGKIAAAQVAGAGGRGGDGGNGGGGGVYMVSGPVSLSGSALIVDNAVNGDSLDGRGGDGGDGGDMQAKFGGAGAGGIGGNGGSVVGGGLAVLSGAVTVGIGTQVTDNSLNGCGCGSAMEAGGGGYGGEGGDAFTGAGKVGGNGGNAGNGGTAFGGGIYAGNGNVVISGGIFGNAVNLGSAAAAGGIGARGGRGKNSGANGKGGNGGAAGGAGVYVAVGSVTLAGAQVVGNEGSGGFGGTGGGDCGCGAATTANGVGRAGGNGGNAGNFLGGGIFAGSGNVLVDLASAVTLNVAIGGEGGDGAFGADGGSGAGIGGAGGNGGASGMALGGGIYAKAGSVIIRGGSTISENQASVSAHGNGDGGGGGWGGGVGGVGGAGGASAKAGGGGVYVVAGNVTVSGKSTVAANKILSGRGQEGGGGGDSKGKAGNGANGTNGSPAVGGGIAVETGNVAVGGFSEVKLNTAVSGLGNDGGDGGFAQTTKGSAGVAGNAGNGGDAGVAQGGGIWVLSGNVVIQGFAQITENEARGGQGGTGGIGGNGAGLVANGAGGNGGKSGNAVGGGLWVQTGSVTVTGNAVFSGNLANHTSEAAGGRGGHRGSAATTGGNAANGSGGGGGFARGGAIFVGAATLTINGRSVFTNNKAVGGDGGVVSSPSLSGSGGGKAGNGGAGGFAEGGAIFSGSGAVTISLASFTANQAVGGAGQAGGDFGTTAGGAGAGGAGGSARGGAIALSAGSLSLTQVNFGGVGATVAGSNLVQINTSETGNTATGGVGGDGGLDATAPGGTGGDSVAGAIYAPATVTSVTILNSSFFNNQAASGGSGGNGSPVGLQGKSVGGALFSEAATTSITNSTFSENSVNVSTTDSSGGAIYLNGVTAKIHNSTIVLNAGDANTQGGGIRANGGTLNIVSTIVGQNGLDASVGAALTGPGKDISAVGALTGDHNMIEDNTGFSGISDGTNGNVIGQPFTDAAFLDNALNSGGPGNTVFVIGSQIAPNGTAAHGLVTSAAFPTLPMGALSAIDGGSNPDNLSVDQVQNLRVQGLAADVGAVEGDGVKNDTQGAFVVSVVFSSKSAPDTATFDTATVGFNEAISSFTLAEVLSLTDPAGNSIAPTAVDVVANTNNQVFEISFPSQSTLGKYTLLLSQSILDMTLNEMDDNQNGINGEAAPNPIGTVGTPGSGDQDLSAGILRDSRITSGAKVTGAVFSGSGKTFNKVELTFDQPINASTFTTGDVTVSGGAGAPPVTVTGVTLKPGTANTFVVTFTPSVGTAVVTLGVDILNFGGIAGSQMNQNGNAINGQAGIAPVGDQFRTSPRILAVGGGNGQVRILSAATGALIATVRPLDVAGGPQYFGLVSVALGDFNADGVDDLVVAPGASRGQGGLSAAKAGKAFVYDGAALARGILKLTHTFTPFASTNGPAGQVGAYINGLNIGVGDVNGDGKIDLIAGTRRGTRSEFARFVVVNKGTDPNGSNDSLIGTPIRPFGDYQQNIFVAAGDLDGVVNASGRLQDEVAVARGLVIESNPNQMVRLAAYKFANSTLVGLNLSGTGSLAPFAGIGSGLAVIRSDVRVTFVDVDNDGKQELIFSALDRTTDPSNVQVRIAAFSVDTTTGLATAISTGSGPSNSYLVGTNVVNHAISGVNPTGTGLNELALITESAASGVQYLDPLTGNVLAGGFPLTITTGGISLSGL